MSSQMFIICYGCIAWGLVEMLLSRVGKWQRTRVAAITAFSFLGIVLFSVPATGGGVFAPAIAAVRSLSSLIGLRSPGDRPEGALGKARRRVPAVGQPSHPVVDSGVRQRLSPRGPAAVPVFPVGGPLEVGSLPGSLADIASFPPAGGGFGFSPLSGPIGGGPVLGGGTGGGSPGGVGGSSGGTGGGGSTGGVINPPLPGAVPEPGTWLMIIAGLGATGAVLRRRSPAPRRIN